MSNENKISSSAGLDLLGSNLLKKNKSIISRVKRSLSASGKPQAQRLPTIATTITTKTTSSHNDILINPEPNYYSTSTPINRGLNISPLPHSHLSYETFASNSNTNLSIRSFPVTRRASTNQVFPKRQTADFLLDKNSNKYQQQPRTILESRVIENDKEVLTKLVKKHQEDDNDDRSSNNTNHNHAPAPAMYWSHPEMYGTLPPQVRAHASAVYEDKMFVFGGSTKSQQCLDTLYILDLDTFTWSKPRVYGNTPPPPSRAHCLTVDNKRGKLYLFGGGDGHRYHNQLYAFDIYTMSWSLMDSSKSRPSERRAHTSIIWHDALYVFGGGDGKKALSDIYKFDLCTAEWQLVVPNGKKPTSRGYHTGTLVGNQWIIYGGSDGKECFGGCHVFDLEKESWHQVHLEEQVPRLSHTAINIGSFLFIIGGHDGSRYCNDLLMLNLVNMAWETRKVYGQAPKPRGYHTTVLYDSRLFIFGGYDGQGFSNDVYVLELSSYAYLPQIINFKIDTQSPQ